MKKRSIIVLALTITALLAAGCAMEEQGGQVKPSPDTPAATQAPATQPPATGAPIPEPGQAETATGGNAMEGAMDKIEAFVEGAVVEAEQLPAKIGEALRQKYPDGSIKTVTYATYQDKQTYKVVMDNAGASEEVYVTAGGEILPANGGATGSNGATGGGAGETTDK